MNRRRKPARVRAAVLHWHHSMLAASTRQAPPAVLRAYAIGLAEVHGFDSHWLLWWWDSCQLGRRPGAHWRTGEPPRIVGTVDALVELILADMARRPREHAA